jgi:hypothetical protein
MVSGFVSLGGYNYGDETEGLRVYLELEEGLIEVTALIEYNELENLGNELIEYYKCQFEDDRVNE